MKEPGVRLKSFPIEKKDAGKRFYAWWYRRKLSGLGYIHVTWIDPSKQEHDFLAQFDGSQVELKNIGSAKSMIFSPDISQSSFRGGYKHFTFSHNDPVQAQLYRGLGVKAMTNDIISMMIKRERMATSAMGSTMQRLKNAAISAALVMSIAIAAVLIISTIGGVTGR